MSMMVRDAILGARLTLVFCNVDVNNSNSGQFQPIVSPFVGISARSQALSTLSALQQSCTIICPRRSHRKLSHEDPRET